MVLTVFWITGAWFHFRSQHCSPEQECSQPDGLILYPGRVTRHHWLTHGALAFQVAASLFVQDLGLDLFLDTASILKHNSSFIYTYCKMKHVWTGHCLLKMT